MYNEMFTLALAVIIAVLFSWAFRALPKENWQVLACLPTRKGQDGMWQGINLTYYGFFNALAYLFAVVMFLIMMGSQNIRVADTILLAVPFLAICMLASRLIARLVEKKRFTFSVGGASFAGILIAPWITLLVNMILGETLGFHLPVLKTLSAIFIAYAFGEGTGRLACISFGCCYGKPVAVCHPLIQRIFHKWNLVFWGKTKKISYAQQLEGQAVVPIQALTAVIYTGVGLLSFYLFLNGFSNAALIITLMVTQLWRFASEFLRADYRGHGLISVYQIMTLIAICYTLVIVTLIKEPDYASPNLLNGVISLWNPGIIVFLVILWGVSFVWAGKSSVTCSSINIQIVEKNI
ncbi:MAG TPA: prolipoprotein diacylglyceryl transferase family protein [Smithella sp.]|nr:prolipoprotein diacylglyceryl transferase family protein [Smithella sp.]